VTDFNVIRLNRLEIGWTLVDAYLFTLDRKHSPVGTRNICPEPVQAFPIAVHKSPRPKCSTQKIRSKSEMVGPWGHGRTKSQVSSESHSEAFYSHLQYVQRAALYTRKSNRISIGHVVGELNWPRLEISDIHITSGIWYTKCQLHNGKPN
jgi:hypothetical protein